MKALLRHGMANAAYDSLAPESGRRSGASDSGFHRSMERLNGWGHSH
jgi:hypothetical protein